MVFHAFGKRFRRLLEPFNQQYWLVTAGAAGLASAFNTSLGGIVFALEELATFHFSQFRTALFSSIIISGMLAQWLVGPYLYFGFPAIGNVPLLSAITRAPFTSLIVVLEMTDRHSAVFPLMLGATLGSATAPRPRDRRDARKARKPRRRTR